MNIYIVIANRLHFSLTNILMMCVPIVIGASKHHYL